MAILRFIIPFSYVALVTLLACAIVLYEPLELTQGLLLAVIIPATLMAFVAFVVLPLYDWLRSSQDEKKRVQRRHVIYRLVLSLLMLIVPVGLARPILEIPEDLSTGLLAATAAVVVLNIGMLVFAEYFTGGPPSE